MQGVTAGAPGQQLKDQAASRHPGALTSGLAAPSGTHELLAARQLQPTRALYLQLHPDPPQGEVGLATAGVGMLLQLRGDRRSAIRRHGLGLCEALIQEWYNGREALIADGVGVPPDSRTASAYNRDRGPVSIFGLRLRPES